MMKSLTTSIYTFADLIEGGYLYVDKTAAIHPLVAHLKGQYFLSRPRRFGKSLLLSTFKAIFQGRRDLFTGLAIDSLPFDWEPHPVVHIDLGARQAVSAEELEENLLDAVAQAAADNDASVTKERPYQAFAELVRLLGKRGKVVILIDEYDKPILGNVDNIPAAKQMLKVLKAFYSVVKATEPDQRFAFLTGVSKFSKVSVFSDLNNLTDLTMDPCAATLLGYTQDELEANFAEAIDELATKEAVSRADMIERIREWYNGYRFNRSGESVYNPVSVMRLFATQEFSNYWFETGTPSFLINLLRQSGRPLSDLEATEIPEVGFAAYEIDHMTVEAMLYQTGYLTLKSYNPESRLYTLGYPNREVRDAFLQYLADAFTPVRKEYALGEAYKLLQALRQGDVDRFMETLTVFFAGIEYDLHVRNEKYYQTIFYLVVRLIGIYDVGTEIKTNRGRADAVIETDERVFVFEFKLYGTAEEALGQIREKRYFEKYLDRGKPIVLVGAAFDPDTRNIEHWLTAQP